jgi:hypothetical protein
VISRPEKLTQMKVPDNLDSIPWWAWGILAVLYVAVFYKTFTR